MAFEGEIFSILLLDFYTIFDFLKLSNRLCINGRLRDLDPQPLATGLPNQKAFWLDRIGDRPSAGLEGYKPLFEYLHFPSYRSFNNRPIGGKLPAEIERQQDVADTVNRCLGTREQRVTGSR